ncbi:hypothetical protein [uncultured Thiohalocapsa sp.]|uniref:hypothetical protein n=1 Tax=uncultured Thiohalocapsa sp. TaxID=768990 RepID=UPI0025E6C3A8|nr:hypothetical protein [uncultured Thiohalocapsa sp.]
MTARFAGSLPGAGLTVGAAEDRSGDEPDPRPLVVHWALPGGAGLLGAVADSVHGQADERKAGQLALDALRQGWRAGPPVALGAEALVDALDQANDLVRQVAAQAAGAAPARISLTLLALHRGRLDWGRLDWEGLDWVSAGDNGLFLLRDDELVSLIEPGFPATVAGCAYLGMERPPALDQSLRPLPLRPGDRLLLSSPAVARHLQPRDIASALRFDAQPAAQELVALTAPAAPGRARVLVIATPPALPAAPAVVHPQGANRGANRSADRGARAQQLASAVVPRSRLPLPRDPVWLAALAATALAVVLGLIALLVHLGARPMPADTAPAPSAADTTPAPAARAQRSPPAQTNQATPAAGAAEMPARPLQYRDLPPAGD